MADVDALQFSLFTLHFDYLYGRIQRNILCPYSKGLFLLGANGAALFLVLDSFVCVLFIEIFSVIFFILYPNVYFDWARGAGARGEPKEEEGNSQARIPLSP